MQKKLILFSLVFLFLMIKNVIADTPVSSCGTLYGSEYYYLTQDIYASGNCFIISGSYVTLDCKGHKITGPSPSQFTGIHILSGYQYSTIRNCIVNNFYNGINIPSSNNNVIYNNLFNNTLNAQGNNYNFWNTNKRLAFNDTGLVGYWRFDEGTGNGVTDSSANGNNGALLPSLIDNFNDGNIDDWSPGCSGQTYSMITPGYEGSYSVRVSPTPSENYLGCYLKPFNAVAGQGITFACRGSGGRVCTVRIWDSTNGKYISSGDGHEWHSGDGNWHIYTTRVDETQSNAYIYFYSLDSGSWAEYDFITLGPMWFDGKYSKGLSFDGLNDYVQVPDSNSLDITNSLTISGWVRPRSYPTGGIGLVSKGPASWDHAYALELDGGSILFRLKNNLGQCWTSSIVGIDTWTHVATTWDGSTMKIYTDGVPRATCSFSDTLPTNSYYLRIGGDYAQGPYYNFFNGLIDEVKIYSRAMTQEEITKEYERGTSGKNIVGGPYMGGNYWDDYTGQDTDGDGLGNSPYNILGGGIDNLPLMKCISNSDCNDNNECTNDQCASGYCSNIVVPDGTSCTGSPGKCCFGICDNNGMTGLSYHPDCRTGPQCLIPGTWDYSSANQGYLCGGSNCVECNLGYCNSNDNSNCVGNCDQCSGNCVPNPSLCSGNCPTCSGSGTNFNCVANDAMCMGNCDFCSGSGTTFNCAANETVCEALKCSDCGSVGGGYFSCIPDLTENEDCNPFDIATCDNDPDAYHFTWDFRDSFCTGLNSCYQGTITHTCNQPTCGAPCDENQDCSNKCNGNKLYFSYSCNSQCNCDLSGLICSVGHCGAECGSDAHCSERCVDNKWYSSYSCNQESCSCETSNPVCSAGHCGAECDLATGCGRGKICNSNCVCELKVGGGCGRNCLMM